MRVHVELHKGRDGASKMFFAPFLVSFYVFGCNNFQKMVFKVQPGSPETILGQDLHYTHFQENTVTD